MIANHIWDVEALRQNLELADAMCATQPPILLSNPQDLLLWQFSTDGAYLVKSGYRRLYDLHSLPPAQTSSSTRTP